jgi:hypothetical protein
VTLHLVSDSGLVLVIFYKKPWLGLLKHFFAVVPVASAAPNEGQDPMLYMGSVVYHESVHISNVKLQYMGVVIIVVK